MSKPRKKYTYLIDGGLSFLLALRCEGLTEKKDVNAEIRDYLYTHLFNKPGFSGKFIWALDCPRKDNFRLNIDPKYKANRKETKVPKWLSYIKKVTGVWGVGYPGLEADDVVGLYKTHMEQLKLHGEHPEEIVVVSADKDLRILAECYIIKPYKASDVYSDKFEFWKANEGLSTWVTLMLEGDSADNIPGARGIGKGFIKEYKKHLAMQATAGKRYKWKNVPNMQASVKHMYNVVYGEENGHKEYQKTKDLVDIVRTTDDHRIDLSGFTFADYQELSDKKKKKN